MFSLERVLLPRGPGQVLTRALEPSPGYVDIKVYELGLDASGNAVRAGPYNDGYRRQVYSGAARVMNVSGRRDSP